MFWSNEFPQLADRTLRQISKAIDTGYLTFSREYGAGIEAFFEPLLFFLIWFERMLLGAPWWVIVAGTAGIGYLASRRWKLLLESSLPCA